MQKPYGIIAAFDTTPALYRACVCSERVFRNPIPMQSAMGIGPLAQPADPPGGGWRGEVAIKP